MSDVSLSPRWHGSTIGVGDGHVAGSNGIEEEVAPIDDGVRVVVVDDDHDVAEVLAEILKGNGYEVRVAHDGLVALAVIEDYRPHCVVLDVNLPGLDGGELAR